MTNQNREDHREPLNTPENNAIFDSVSRRGFVKKSAIVGAGLTSFFTSLATKASRTFAQIGAPISLPPDAPVEYIIVGSGAGGGPLACNLAKAGHKVVLIEAGGDYVETATPENPSPVPVPFYSSFASEDDRISWDYYVRHYTDQARQTQDKKYIPERDAVWYPRVGSLGGCTIHSFLVEIYPNNSDWDYIAKLTGDYSWNARNMRKYYERFERCRHVARPRGGDPSRHGFNGWQTTEIPDPSVFAQDALIRRILQAAANLVGPRGVLAKLFQRKLDPNDWRVLERREGMYNIPQFMDKGQRRGPRELIRETVAALPNNLIVMTHTLATRVVFEGTTAVGIEYVQGAKLYRADPNPSQAPLPPRQELRATREVILSGGAFNSPQLLKLSGIGPAEELQKFGITPIVNLPGVGKNLQDRYEVGIISEATSDFTFANACRPGQADDPCFAQWFQGQGLYTSIGALNAIIHKSKTAKRSKAPDPDLFIFSAPIPFRGYYHGYSIPVATTRNQFTWAALKGNTLNRGGTVELKSADPRDTPFINFHYFYEGTDKAGNDLNSVIDGIEFIRQINAQLSDVATEVWPGPQVKTREQLAEFVMNDAWGHHASCSNKMGPRTDPMAVVDSKFRVHGTRNLRVVDASVFPRIPGYFILVPIYMISEKASDLILATARS